MSNNIDELEKSARMAYLRLAMITTPRDTLLDRRNSMLREIDNEESNLATYAAEVEASNELIAGLKLAVTEHDRLIERLDASQSDDRATD